LPCWAQSLQAEATKRGIVIGTNDRVDCEVAPDWFHEFQTQAWESEARIVAILAGWQSGKALAIETPILTSGGFKRMGDMKPGDMVFGRDGKPCNVVGVSPVYVPKKCYLLTFCDGTEMVADGEHQWLAWNQKDRQRNPDGRVVTTQQMVDFGVKAQDGGAQWSIPLPSPVELPRRDYSLDPYVLGAWLGDGTSRSCQITVAEQDIVDNITKAGVTLTPVQCQNSGKATTYKMVGAELNLRARDLWCNKHIPEEYKLGSVDQRLELLRGMMDTDGYCDPDGHLEYCTVREDLAMDFAEVVRSLGVKCRVKVNRAALYGKDCGPRYRVMFYTGIQMFHVKRKAERQKAPSRPDVYARYIRRIEPIKPRPVRCISVDSSDSLYVASRDYVVTHNTVTLPWLLLREIQRCGPGDYGAFSTTYKLLERKFRPELAKVFKPYAKYNKADQQFVFTDAGSRMLWGDEWDGSPTIVQLGYAENPDSLESATMKAVAWDEPGQNAVPEQAFLTVWSRLMVNMGRLFLASRPYVFNWFEKLTRERWHNADVISFPSHANPVNPPEHDPYWKSLRDTMPAWLYTMLYEGRYTRPAGLVFDCFDRAKHCIPPLPGGLPEGSEIYTSWDFGGRNTAAVIWAKVPGDGIHIIRTYKKESASVPDHVRAIRMYAPGEIKRSVGGAKSENSWRQHFKVAGLAISEPRISGLEETMSCLYALFSMDRLKIWEWEGTEPLIREIETLSREVDDDGTVLENIVDESKYHRIAAARYGATMFFRPTQNHYDRPYPDEFYESD